jgi:hypothetical protein
MGLRPGCPGPSQGNYGTHVRQQGTLGAGGKIGKLVYLGVHGCTQDPCLPDAYLGLPGFRVDSGPQLTRAALCMLKLLCDPIQVTGSPGRLLAPCASEQ